MKRKANGILIFRDLVAEMDAFNDLAVDALFSEEAAAKFREYVEELDEWQPAAGQPFDVLSNGLFAMIMGAYALHNKAMMQEAGGDAGASPDIFWIAQDCLRKAVVALQRSVEVAAGITREAATSPRPEHTVH
jgi:hypothetical protein